MGFIELFFPKQCLVCKKGNKYICSDCLEKVRKPMSICPMCKKFSFSGKTHEKCMRSQSLDGFTAIWKYEGVIRQAILKLKYKFASDIAEEIIERAIPKLRDISPINTFHNILLIPIPDHRLRKNWRGFNQTELLGRLLSREMNWGFNSKVLFRKRNVLPQVGLEGKERIKNIRGVFGIKKEKNLLTDYESIVLFDDVWTTGSTIKEAGKVLKRNGFRKVWALTLAC